MNYKEVDVFLHDKRHLDERWNLEIKVPAKFAEMMCECEQAYNALDRIKERLRDIRLSNEKKYRYSFPSESAMSSAIQSVCSAMCDAWRATVRYNNEDELPSELRSRVFQIDHEIEKLKYEKEYCEKTLEEYGEPDVPEGVYHNDEHLLPKKRPLNKKSTERSKNKEVKK